MTGSQSNATMRSLALAVEREEAEERRAAGENAGEKDACAAQGPHAQPLASSKG